VVARMRLLLIEDEKKLAETLVQLLRKESYLVDVSYDGEDGLYNALTGIYDLILLDIMLPKVDGLTILKTIRKEAIQTPVIMLTAKSEIDDTVTGLDYGADDYLAKPFDIKELLARIRANVRRRNEPVIDLLRYGDLKLDKETLQLNKDSKAITLTLKEAELMELFMLNSKITLSKDLIIDKIWGFEAEVDYNHVEVYISFLRKKLKFLNSEVAIFTLRGVGYTLKGGEGDV